jgi:hypothetical protein
VKNKGDNKMDTTATEKQVKLLDEYLDKIKLMLNMGRTDNVTALTRQMRNELTSLLEIVYTQEREKQRVTK